MISLLVPDKETVLCASQKGGITECGSESWEPADAGGVWQAVVWCGRVTVQIRWAGAGWEARTSNMRDMLVTLDVSRLSGWLKADA